MALPGSCESPVAACCETLYDLVTLYVTAAADAVVDCLGDFCGDFGRFVAHDVPTGPGNYVAGWWANLRPVQQTQGKQLMVPKMAAVVHIQLIEDGYPQMAVAGDRILLPMHANIDYAAQHSYSHAEAATRAILSNLNATGICDSVRFLQMLPLPVEASYIGWEWRLAAEMRF